MTTHVALLRGVNVGGHKKVAMSDLRDFITELGFDDVRSLLQSGNLVFQGGARSGADLERMLEVAAQERLGLTRLPTYTWNYLWLCHAHYELSQPKYS